MECKATRLLVGTAVKPYGDSTSRLVLQLFLLSLCLDSPVIKKVFLLWLFWSW